MTPNGQGQAEAVLRAYVEGPANEVDQLWARVVQSTPSLDLVHRFGVHALQLGKNDRAIRLLEAARPEQNAPAEFLIDLGVAYRRLKRHVDAEQCYREALRASPSNADAYNNLGNVQRDEGRAE